MNFTLLKLHLNLQSIQRIQSCLCNVSSSKAVGQIFLHSPQSVHSLLGNLLKIENLLAKPSNVPRGQRFLHQFLFSYFSRNMIKANMMKDMKADG